MSEYVMRDTVLTYETALIAFWKKFRPDENPDQRQQILTDPMMRAFVQAAFEAGRTWQADHPTASIEFPDYDAPSMNASPNKESFNINTLLYVLKPEQRLEVFSSYCRHCGDTNPRCQCWNDE